MSIEQLFIGLKGYSSWNKLTNWKIAFIFNRKFIYFSSFKFKHCFFIKKKYAFDSIKYEKAFLIKVQGLSKINVCICKGEDCWHAHCKSLITVERSNEQWPNNSSGFNHKLRSDGPPGHSSQMECVNFMQNSIRRDCNF